MLYFWLFLVIVILDVLLTYLLFRIWKRCTSKKRKLREHKQLTANAALNLLSLGPPIWQFEVVSILKKAVFSYYILRCTRCISHLFCDSCLGSTFLSIL